MKHLYEVAVSTHQMAKSAEDARLKFAKWLQSIPVEELADSIVVLHSPTDEAFS